MHLRICPMSYLFLPVSAGMRIATPRRPKVRHALLWPLARAGQRSLGTPLPAKGSPLRGPHALARNDIHKLAACPHCKNALPGQIPTRLWVHPAAPPCNRRSPSVFCMSLRGAGRGTWQSVLLAVVLNEKQYPRQIRNHLRIRPEYCVFFPISAGHGLRTSDIGHWFAMTC